MVCDNGERELEINARNLIWKLCICSKSYYEKNKDKFNIQIFAFVRVLKLYGIYTLNFGVKTSQVNVSQKS